MSTTAIIFDFFGVICSEIAPFWFEKYFPPDEAKRLKSFYSTPADQGKISENELFNILGKLIQKTPEEVKSEFKSYIKIDDKVVSLIKHLKPTYKLGLCTNSPSQLIRTILKSHDLTDLFDGIVVSSEIGITKPDQKIYELILKKLAVKAPDSVFIDDNSLHLGTAQALGMKTILFSDFEKTKSELSNLGIKITPSE